jgi:hypothetical protein
MKDIVEEAIRFYYDEPHDEEYLERCRGPLDVADVVASAAAEFAEEVQTPDPYWAFWPAYKVKADFGTCRKRDFEAEFESTILVSKLVKFFHVTHYFSVENRYGKRVAPTLDGYSGMGYIMPQFNMHETLRERLTERGYAELDLADMEEIVPALSFPEGVTIFGRQVSIQYALFHDLRGLCPQD